MIPFLGHILGAKEVDFELYGGSTYSRAHLLLPLLLKPLLTLDPALACIHSVTLASVDARRERTYFTIERHNDITIQL
jgi:hypothetical protein